MQPYISLPPVEIPGVGQIPGSTISDAATWAEYALKMGGGLYALYYREELERLVAMKVWRSEAAADILARILRAAAIEMQAKEMIHGRENLFSSSDAVTQYATHA